MAARVVAALTDLARAPRAPGEATLVISHGGAIRTFIHEVTDAAPPPLDNGAAFLARWSFFPPLPSSEEGRGEGQFISVTPL